MSTTQIHQHMNPSMHQPSNLMGSGGPAVADMSQNRPLAMQKRNSQNYQKYMDKMDSALHKNIEKNIFPYWRNHQSLKGWCSMNYPSILTNPTIRRPKPQPDYDKYKFSNQERPISAPNIKIQRPFSTKTFGGGQFQPRGLLYNNQSIDKISFIGSINSGGGGVDHHRINLGGMLSTGQSLADLSKIPGSAIGTVERIVSALPQPKRPNTTVKKKEGEAALPVKKSKGALTAIPEKKMPENETNETALKSATSWANFQQIQKKLSVGAVTTTKYQERAQIFDKLNEKAKEHSSIQPQSNYFGQTPDPLKDPYDRRKVKQLNDISFEDSEDEEEFEETKNLRRLPRTVITEETLKDYLGPETEKLNLEHHYWIKEHFLDKVGRMAANLKELSLRRLKVSNRAFSDIVLHLRRLERVDISDCPNIHSTGMKIMLDNNRNLKQIQASNCANAISDEVVAKLAHFQQLTFLDISYAVHVTDTSLHAFHDISLPLAKLFVNGLTSITALGLSELIGCCKETLKVLEASLMNQEHMTANFCMPLSFCFHLEELDLTGNVNMGDDGLSALPKGDVKNEQGLSHVIGLAKLKIAKFSGLTKLGDHTLMKIVNSSNCLEHLELTKCEALTEYSIDQIVKQCNTLKFIDLNSIPAITQPVLETLRQAKPDLLIRRFLYQVADPKDNGLRVPRRIVDKKKKKKKGKKGGKKKK